MTLDRDFDRITSAWLDDGPTELSDRVIDAVVDQIHLTRQRRATRAPWRFQTMSMFARVAALVAVGALAIAGAVALAGAGGRLSVSPSLPALDRRFDSTWHGYSVNYPSGWTASAADRSWKSGARSVWGSLELDQIKSDEIRFTAEQQLIPRGHTAEEWLLDYCQANGLSDCASLVPSWTTFQVAGETAYLDADGVTAAPSSVYPGGKLYEAVVTPQDRAYVFRLDGKVDRSVFNAFLATIHLSPANAVDMTKPTGTYTSPTYGYSIPIDPSWLTRNATKPWRDYSNSSDFMDEIDVPAADASFSAMSQALGGRTFDEFLRHFYEGQVAAVGTDCAGGDPSTWADIKIGPRTGKLERQCGTSEALVQAGDRIYLFEWGNSGFSPDPNVSYASWKMLLQGVTFDPAKATN